MSVETLNENTHPEDYARARQMLENCDWFDYDDDGKRCDNGLFKVDEDVVIATMIHFRNAELIAAEQERDGLTYHKYSNCRAIREMGPINCTGKKL